MDYQHTQNHEDCNQWGLMGFGKPVRSFVGLIVGFVLLLALTSCQQEIVASAAVVSTVAPTPTTAPTVSPTLPPPPTTLLMDSDAPSAQMPSFAAVDPTQLEAAQAEITAVETAVSEPTSSAPESTATETVTPIPTFTPPALPFTSDEEHYWLKRPIPEGGTVWTNKIYPYGSSKGGTLRPHHGVEFDVNKGTQVIAAASGTVVVAGKDDVIAYGPTTNFYGNLVVIELDTPFEGQPVYNLYAHLSDIYVAEGQHVEAEQLIALSGASGVADGPHLHFEVRLGQNNYDATYNPSLWLYPFPDYGTVAGRVVRGNGSIVEDATVSLDRVDAASRFLAISTYTGDSVNPDAQWNENFVLDDVPMGYYEVTVAVGKKKFKQEIYVFPYRTNFVEIVIED
ncbi:MAG: M23 family metallopeptidase [Anaerolineae bacterium]|nr:M23 family metallopeptidase [Anaerolineae bacterium]